MIFVNLQLPQDPIKLKYKTFNTNGLMTTFYYNTEYELKLYELYLDCLNYKYCPICTNKLKSYEYDDTRLVYFCNDDDFFISSNYFHFSLFGNIYIYNSSQPYFFTSHNKDMIPFKSIIADIDSLTLITLYNNLKKYITFQ